MGGGVEAGTSKGELQVSDMTVKQLKQECKRFQVKGYSDMLRPELRMKLIEARRGLQNLGRFFKPKDPPRANDTREERREVEDDGAVRREARGDHEHECEDSPEGLEEARSREAAAESPGPQIPVLRTPARKRKRGERGGREEEELNTISWIRRF